jgi:hypothetical protein
MAFPLGYRGWDGELDEGFFKTSPQALEQNLTGPFVQASSAYNNY